MSTDLPDLMPLRDAVEAALRADVADVLAQAKKKHVYAIALGFVEDPTGFFVAGATREWAAKKLAKHPKEDAPSSLWYPSEWPLAGRARTTPSVYEVISELAEDADEDDRRAAYEDITVEVLRRLRAAGVLRNANGTDLWVWLHYADAFDEDIDDRTFALLNHDAGFAERWDVDAPINAGLRGVGDR